MCTLDAGGGGDEPYAVLRKGLARSQRGTGRSGDAWGGRGLSRITRAKRRPGPAAWFPGHPRSGINESQPLEQNMPVNPVCLFRLGADRSTDVETVFDDLQNYSLFVDGKRRRTDAVAEFATALPSGSQVQDKHAFVAYRQGLPVGVLDIIDGYPVPGTAFIGLLAIRESLHGFGLGRSLYAQAEQFMRNDLKARSARIAVIETNPVGGFWTRMGFEPTGEVKPYEGEAVRSRSNMMEKSLSSAFDR